MWFVWFWLSILHKFSHCGLEIVIYHLEFILLGSLMWKLKLVLRVFAFVQFSFLYKMLLHILEYKVQMKIVGKAGKGKQNSIGKRGKKKKTLTSDLFQCSRMSIIMPVSQFFTLHIQYIVVISITKKYCQINKCQSQSFIFFYLEHKIQFLCLNAF